MEISSTDNGNTRVELSVHDLAPPGRVSQAATVYVVWVRGNEPGAEPQNIGALKVDSDLNGNLAGITPLRSFQLFVTAEPSQATTTPSGTHLLYTTVAMR